MSALPLAAEKAKPMDAGDVRECIRSHYGVNGDQYSVLFEVRNGTAWRANRSVDAVVMSLWPSLGMHLSGMEIKVNRYDWRREVENPEKASEVFDYFDKWYLVAPADVAKFEELPEPWGWLVPENGRLREVRPAAINPNVKPPSRHFLAAIMRNQVRVGEAPMNRAIENALAQQRRAHEADLEKKILQRLGDARTDAEQWAKVRDLLKTKPDQYIYQDDVIEALRILVKAGVGKSYSSLRSLLAEVKRNHDALAAIAADLGVDIEEPKRRRRG